MYFRKNSHLSASTTASYYGLSWLWIGETPGHGFPRLRRQVFLKKAYLRPIGNKLASEKPNIYDINCSTLELHCKIIQNFFKAAKS